MVAVALQEPVRRNGGWRPLNLSESLGQGESFTWPFRHLQAVHAG